MDLFSAGAIDGKKLHQKFVFIICFSMKHIIQSLVIKLNAILQLKWNLIDWL